jgi:gliding motility-associated-like protein
MFKFWRMKFRNFGILFFLLILSQKQYAQYTVNNNAAQIACNEYRLTNAANAQSGSVWNNTKINLTQSFDFVFSVFLGNNDSPGADGMAFVLQPISTSVGTSGGGLGFQNINPSVGITIDTYQNGVDNDPAFDHIAMQLNGNINHNSINNIAGPVTAINGSNNIEDGVWHLFRVVWDAPTTTYTAYIDGNLRLTAVKNFVTDIFAGDPLVYWGFTASTGGENNYQAFKTVLAPSYTFNAAQKKCVNEPITFTNTTVSFSPIVNVFWNFGDGTPVDLSISPVHTYTVAGDYIVTQRVIGLDGCEQTNTQPIRIGTKPIAGFSNDKNCNLTAINFTDTSTTLVGTINNWFWDFDNGGLTSTQQNPSTTYSVAGPKAIKLVVKSIEGCLSDTLYKTILIYPIPTAPVVSSTPIGYCQGATATALAAAGTNLLWYANATGGTGSTAATIPSTANVGSTIYYVSQTTGGCEGPRAAITVTINSSPAAPVVTQSLGYCQNSASSMLTAAGTNLLWYFSLAGGVGITTAPTPSTTASGIFSYYVTQTVNNCESQRALIDVTIGAIPVAPTVTSPVIYCQNETATAVPGISSSTLWYTAATGGTGNATPLVPITTSIGNTNYYIGTTNTFSINNPPTQTTLTCVGSRTLLVVTINPTPGAPTVTSPITYCENAPTNALTATGTNLQWYTTATGGTASSIAPIPSSTTIGTNTYYVSQSIGNCEGPRAAIIVNIISTSTTPVVSPKNYCPNDIAQPLTAIGTNLLWYTTATGGVGTSIAPTPNTVIFPATYNYYVSQTIGTCESQRALLVVTIDNNLSLNVGVDTTICEGSSLKFNPTITPAAAATYEWFANGVPLNTIDDRFIKDATVNPVDSAEYILKATIGGCSKTDTVKINVIWKPKINAGLPKSICLDSAILLKGIMTRVSNDSINYSWTPIDSLATPSLLQTLAYPTSTTLYTVTYQTKPTYGCDFSGASAVKIFVQKIDKAFAGNDTIAAKGLPHQLRGSGGINYSWFSPSGISISNPFAQNTFVTLNNDAQFYLKVTNAIGCEGRDTIFVKVYDGPNYYIPNSFTPNGDGKNDIFRAVPAGIAYTVYFRVFDRLGQLVFETNQWLKGWDGTFKGKPQPIGTYVWMIAGTDKYNKKIEMKGTVNLLR